MAKKLSGKQIARASVRLKLAKAAVSGQPVSKAARELGVPTSTAYRLFSHPDTTSIIKELMDDRRADFRELFDRTINSLLVDTEHLAAESSTLDERQSIRAEVLKVINLVWNSSPKNTDTQQQATGPHVTFQTLVQFVNSQPSTSNGPTALPAPSIEKSPDHST